MLKQQQRRVIVRMKESSAIENALPVSPAGFGESPYKCTPLHVDANGTQEPYEIPQKIEDRPQAIQSVTYGEDYGAMSEEAKCLRRTYTIEAPDGADLETLIAEMNGNAEVEYAQIDELNEILMIPNDPSFNDLWGLQKINCEPAWEISEGEDVVVAVVDTGVDYNHPDMRGNMWTSADGKFGFDFSDNDDNPMDYHGHGSHVAGTVAAVGNNQTGVIGVAPKAKIMAIKIFPNAFDSVIARALRWAVDNGAKVLNNSWGPRNRRPHNPVVEDAINYVNSKGGICIFAAGNSNDDTQFYSPANMTNVITVGATDKNDRRAGFSNWGAPVDVSAPGVDILSLEFKTSNYVSKQGTSMASPHVAGLVALALKIKPEATFEEIQRRINNGVDLIQPDKALGRGRINALHTLQNMLFKLQTGTVLSETGDNFEFALAANRDIFAIKKRGTGTNSTEVHVLSAAQNYQAFSLQTGTPLHESGNNFKFLLAPNRDLFVIKKDQTGSNSTEVHILSASSNYRRYSLHTSTALHETGDDFDFVLAPNRDLVAIKKRNTGSDATEVHILSAATKYRSFALHTSTRLEETGDNFEFAMAPNRDLIAIKKNSTGTGSTEFHVLSAAHNYNSFSVQTDTILHETGDNFTFAFAPESDLVAIKKNNTGTNSTEVHILQVSKYKVPATSEAVFAKL